MNYGALTTGIYWSYLSGDEEKNYYYSGWDYTYVSDSDGNSVKVLKNMLDEVHYQNHEVVVVGWDDEYPRENFRYRIDRDTEGVVMDGPGQEATPSDMEKGASFEPFSGGRRRSAGRAATPSDLELSESEIATGSDMKAERDDEEGGIDKDEFLDSLLPERDGAWIIRNSWGTGAGEDAQGRLRWELSGDLSAVDTSDFEAETGGTGLTENGEAVCLFTPEESQVNPIFSSDNPNIAAVDDSGLVLGVDSGTTVIRVRAGGEEAVCTVTVWKPGRSEGGDSDGGAGNSGKDRPVHGSWIQVADGSWNFSAGGSTYQNTWGYLYNPYGASGAGEAGWFRFDAAGRLLTGWFQDEDGSWYYLNPISDGSLGKMATGWRWIPDASGREYCYYFHPNAGGPMGAMAASGKTPDGYEVDAQGRWCADGTPQTR